MGISDEEATPLVIDDREDEAPAKWLLAGKVLNRNLLHIQTISNALRPAWGNPRGLKFTSMGDNMFVAVFESKRDKDRIWDGSPWHVSKNAVILAEFEECMRPDEVSFDRLQLWARVINLPYNLRDDVWGKEIANQIDKNASSVQFDHTGGYLHARVTIDVSKPLRRWIPIESARRKKQDLYEIQYEHVPHFCFSCGRLGHSELFCPTPSKRDKNGELPFGASLRAPEERRKDFSGDSTKREYASTSTSKRESKNSSNVATGKTTAEVTSPIKSRLPKRKEVPMQEYLRVNQPPLLLKSAMEHEDAEGNLLNSEDGSEGQSEEDIIGKNKKPTPANSTEAARQPCPSK